MNKQFLLPEDVCCCLQNCFDESLSLYISVPSMVVSKPSIRNYSHQRQLQVLLPVVVYSSVLMFPCHST